MQKAGELPTSVGTHASFLTNDIVFAEKRALGLCRTGMARCCCAGAHRWRAPGAVAVAVAAVAAVLGAAQSASGPAPRCRGLSRWPQAWGGCQGWQGYCINVSRFCAVLKYIIFYNVMPTK